MNHGFVPDPLVENDASPCEICGGRFDEHSDYALYVRETDKERADLEAQLTQAREELTKAIAARDANYAQRNKLEEALAAYEKAWALPPQGIGQMVTPSAGEVAANAVEEAKLYREQRDSARAALAEAARDKPNGYLGMVQRIADMKNQRDDALAALREMRDFLGPSSSGWAHSAVAIANRVLNATEAAAPKKHSATPWQTDPLWCLCGFPVDEYNIHFKPRK